MPQSYRRSYSRSPRRSRSRDRYRDERYDRDRYNERSYRDRDDSEEDGYRVHVADLTDSVSQYEIEKVFSKFGDIKEVWLAKNPPCFAFVVYKNKDDAEAAVKEMDSRTVGNSRVRVTFARPRTKGKRRRWDPNMRCYQCGGKGHFSRDCNGFSRSNRRRSSSRSRYDRHRSRSRHRSYSRN